MFLVTSGIIYLIFSSQSFYQSAQPLRSINSLRDMTVLGINSSLYEQVKGWKWGEL